jgi:hypothetical protein
MIETELARLTADFSAQIVKVIESSVEVRIRGALEAAFSGAKRGPGRPRKIPLGEGPIALAIPSTRKKGPKQLCPVPGCKNPAAPVFGMVCSEHKNVPKAKIKKYREARKAAKGGGKARQPAKAAPKQRKRKVIAKRAKKVTGKKAKATRVRKVAEKPVTPPHPSSDASAS